jgi:hypothetical protein
MNEPICLNCGVPLTRNRHPLAGKMSHLNIVGAEWGCLPCAEMRANGRHRVLSVLREEMHNRIKSGVPMSCAAMLGMIESLDEVRRLRAVEEALNCRDMIAIEQPRTSDTMKPD